MPAFHHDRLISYQAAIRYAALAAQIIPAIEPLYGHLRDQLARATTSIALNIGEGAHEFLHKEKHKFYRYARRSAGECAAIMDVLEAVGYPRVELLSEGRDMLDGIVAMLTSMCRPDAGRTRDGRRTATAERGNAK